MNCPKCNAVNADGAKFCVGCGTPLNAVPVEPVQPVQQYQPAQQPVYAAPAAPAAPAQLAKEKKPATKFDATVITGSLLSIFKPIANKAKPILSNKKAMIGIVAGAVALIAIIIVCAVLGSGNGYVEAKQSIRFLPNGDETSIIVDNKLLKDTIDGKVVSPSYSLNGKVAAALTAEDELYVVDGKKLKLIAEDVADFTLSVTGKGIVYVTEEDVLYLAKTSNGKSTEICDELDNSNYCISPDGKSVVYFEGDDMMLFKGKEPTKIGSGKDLAVYGLSNGGKYIYVVDESEDARLFVYDKKGDKEKIGSFGGNVRFNDDHTMIMFTNEKGQTCVSKNGKEAVKASSDSLNLIMAPNTNGSISDDFATTYPVSDLYGHVYRSGDEVWLIKKNSDKNVKLVSNASGIQLDESAEYLYYIYKGDELRMIKISDGIKASEKYKTIVDDDITSYVVTSDRKYVYFTDGDELYSVNGKKGGRTTSIADDLERSIADGLERSIQLSGKDVLFYIIDGDLHACTNGKKDSKVLSDIDVLVAMPSGAVYATNDDSIYASTGSKKLKKILDL